MRKVLWTTLLLAACSSDDSSGERVAEDACNDKFAVLCESAFGCLDPAELSGLADTVGTNEAECRELFAQYCTPEMVACAPDQEYRPEMGRDCVAAFERFSCDELRGYLIDGTTPEPAACDQVCTP